MRCGATGAGSRDGDWAKPATVTRRKHRVSVAALNIRAITDLPPPSHTQRSRSRGARVAWTNAHVQT